MDLHHGFMGLSPLSSLMIENNPRFKQSRWLLVPAVLCWKLFLRNYTMKLFLQMFRSCLITYTVPASPRNKAAGVQFLTQFLRVRSLDEPLLCLESVSKSVDASVMEISSL
jgi:hypothetical protein